MSEAERYLIELDDLSRATTAKRTTSGSKHGCTGKIAGIDYPHSHVPEPSRGCELGDVVGELTTWIRNRRVERRGCRFGRAHEHEVLGPSLHFCAVPDNVHRCQECYVGVAAGICTVSRANRQWMTVRNFSNRVVEPPRISGESVGPSRH